MDDPRPPRVALFSSGYTPYYLFGGSAFAELAAAGVAPLAKTLHVDLNAVGYNGVEKVEGLAVVDDDTIAVLTTTTLRSRAS